MPASIHNYPARDMMQGRREAGMKVHGSGTAPRPGGGGLAAPLVRKGNIKEFFETHVTTLC